MQNETVVKLYPPYSRTAVSVFESAQQILPQLFTIHFSLFSKTSFVKLDGIYIRTTVILHS